jgi:hypothetical protein
MAGNFVEPRPLRPASLTQLTPSAARLCAVNSPRKRRGRPAPILEWVEGSPPPANNGERHHKKPVGFRSPTIRALKAWPGRWAIVYRTPVRQSATSRASYLKLHNCEVLTRKFSPIGESAPLVTAEPVAIFLVYARWVAHEPCPLYVECLDCARLNQ